MVAKNRRRNLAVSFGILLILSLGMGMIVVSSRRAQRLAKLQMDFVAGVSHELRTPLAVICSAAENLADGVVDSERQVKEYGGLIRDEGRRLTGMVEQTLQFAAGQSERRRYELRTVAAAEAVETALKDARSTIEAAQVEIETRIDPGLPDVQVDVAALSQCLQNLINNALKYGGGWLGVRANTAPAGDAREVRISVEDRGPGIEPSELPHLFEPFFRGRKASDGQIHGTGLGLSLTREMIEAMGGRISVESEPSKGSTFTIHLPEASGRAPGPVPNEA
jgi:signal transduction histidine kinase